MGKQSELTFQSLDVAAVQIDGKREYQEDAYKILLNETNPPHMLSLLADGMGGHAAGDIAANLAIDVFLNLYPCRTARVTNNLCTVSIRLTERFRMPCHKTQNMQAWAVRLLASKSTTINAIG